MTSARLFLCAITLSCINTEAQTLPAFIKNLSLKPNQSVVSWFRSSERYDIHTYLDDGIMNDRTIDSLATDSRIFMDSVINKLGSGCDFLGFRYINRSACEEESSIWLQYWLRNGKIKRIDSLANEHYKGDIQFPLLSNQYFLVEHIATPDTSIHDLIFCNIISENKKLDDSLNRDNKRIFLKLLNYPPPTGLKYSSIRIQYVNQLGGGILKEYKYPLTAPYSVGHYRNMYKNEK